MSKKSIDIITMGCSKNLVDSERLIRMFSDAGFSVRHNPDSVGADEVVINTCGFIGDAKQESIDMILQCAQLKDEGLISHISVMGCLSERYRSELPAELPEVDRWYGKFDWTALLADIARKSPEGLPYRRTLTTPPHHAYVKISEGCDRFCAFCAIPLITGRMHSRPVEEIVDEVRSLVARGVKEFNIIAQDLSSYGKDIYGHKALARLIEAVADVPGVEWIRLHYAYPADFPYDILPVMASRPNVCRYLDIALQHASDKVLANMRRHITADETRALLARIRREVPGIHIRTTLMVGHPGETEEDFKQLIDFVKWARFERMGAFAYSEEEGTYSALHYQDDIPQEVKEARLSKLMRVQQAISADVQESKVGQTMRVIIDRQEGDYFVGRTEFDSPEVDPEVLIHADEGLALPTGSFQWVRIDSADDFDLYGHCVDGPAN